MAERPLLALPRPALVAQPKLGGGGSTPHLPTKDTQVARFGPGFARLREVLASRTADPMELRDDPTSLAPDRVIVFEIAGSAGWLPQNNQAGPLSPRRARALAHAAFRRSHRSGV